MATFGVVWRSSRDMLHINNVSAKQKRPDEGQGAGFGEGEQRTFSICLITVQLLFCPTDYVTDDKCDIILELIDLLICIEIIQQKGW
jgi:hypothetical protein